MILLFGFPLWVLAVELILFITWVIFTEIEYYGWSTFIFVASVASVHFLLKINLLQYAKEHFGFIALLIGANIVAGLIWSIFVKWVLFLYKFKEARQEALDKLSKNDFSYTELEYLKTKSFHRTSLSEAPLFRDYKGKIVAWTIFWIPSLIGTLCDDFVRKLITWIVSRFEGIGQYMSNKIVGDFSELKNDIK